VTVVALAERRGPAREAQLLYEESEASRTAREAAAEQRRLTAGDRRQGRPTKRNRRQLVHLFRDS